MKIYTLEEPEKTLFDAIRDGKPTRFDSDKPREIKADVLRHIILGLPIEEEDGGILLKAASLFGISRPSTQCRITGIGISIENAVINDRLALDSVVGPEGGPICPLQFRKCTFTGGFSGAHGHFSRLSFSQCIFAVVGDPVDPNSGCPMPTIDLTGARVAGRLDMDGICPKLETGGRLWISAPGIRVGGGICLSGASLRAPAPAAGREPWGHAEDALDLTLSEIGGDLSFSEGSSAAGRLKLRGAQIHGDLWLNRSTLENPGAKTEALFLQGARIDGFLCTATSCDQAADSFSCTGNIDLTAIEVGHSLIFVKAAVTGSIKAPDLTVRDDFYLHAVVEGRIDLEHATIGGSLDISGLCIEPPPKSSPPPPPEGADTEPSPAEAEPDLLLKDGSIGQALRLAPVRRAPERRFALTGVADLRGLTCDTLDDEAGKLWGSDVRIFLDNFVYRRAGWHASNRKRKPSFTIVNDWFLAKRAEWFWRRKANTVADRRHHQADFWEPWQVRRNWIYQQFELPRRQRDWAARPVPVFRFGIEEEDYRPQPFEQAIRVARAEGRDDFATHFEMLKQWIEWRFFNRMVRWWLGYVAIFVAAGWLIVNHGPGPELFASPDTIRAVARALIPTLILMYLATPIYRVVRFFFWWAPYPVRVFLTWAIFFVPTGILWWRSEWSGRPLHFLISFLIFMAIRFIGPFAHATMRFGFGYLRRPVRAVATLIAVFLLGWWGVRVANANHMLVVAAEPVAGLVAPHRPEQPERPGAPLLVMGNENLAGAGRFTRDISCAHEVSEPLYALDVLIPLVDLHEESRCEVRRLPRHGGEGPILAEMDLSTLLGSIPEITIENHRFWWLMKALYAIAGWFIVSLSILTFAQVNRTHAEPPTEHK